MPPPTTPATSPEALALIEREERLRAILDGAVDAIITIDQRGLIESVNPAAQKLFGYSAEEMLGQNVSMLMPSPHREQHDGYLQRYEETGVPRIIGIGREVMALRKDGTHCPVHLAVSVVNLPRGRLFTAILHDLTKRRRLEELVLEATSLEQKRIGQDLHDGIGQQLAGLSFYCKSLSDRLAAKGLPEAADAQRMGQLIDQSKAQVRALSHGLNPVVDKPQGLMRALEELAEYVSSTFGIACSFNRKAEVLLDDVAMSTHVFRIAQEAATNALKHGRARNIRISLDQLCGQNCLCIEDDGNGISICPMNRTGGIGLEIMKSRASIIGGTLEIFAAANGGTVVRCYFPR